MERKNTLIRIVAILIITALVLGMLPLTSLILKAGGSALVLTGHDLSYSSGATLLDSSFEVAFDGTITGGKIYIETGFSNGDILSCTNLGGITGSYNTGTGIMTISGSADAASYQNFMRNVRFSSTAVSGSRTVIISLTTSDGSILYSSTTGHYYEYVPTAGLTWTQARDAAAARSYAGLTGYLVTITSSAENAFVAAKCAGDGWMGASDDGHDKEWYWVTGPEAGSKFCQQNAYTGFGTGVGVAYTVNGWYQNFAPGEPNDWKSSNSGSADGENYCHMYASNGTWNDFAAGNLNTQGYLVEYGTTFMQPSGSVTSILVTINADATAPTISGIEMTPSAFTNQDVTLTVNATDDSSGIAAYSFDSGINWQTSATKSYSVNTTIAAGTIRVKDNAGNVASYNHETVIANIDKIAPVINSVTANPSSYTDQNVTLTVEASDVGLGIEFYSFDSGATWQTGNTYTCISNKTYEQNAIMVKDKAGNTGSYPLAVVVDYIDKTSPVLTMISPSKMVNVSELKASSSKEGRIFVVPAGDYANLQDLLNAAPKGRVATCSANTPVSININNLNGNYAVYAVDLLNHLSNSAVVNIAFPLVVGDPGTVNAASSSATTSVSSTAASSTAVSSPSSLASTDNQKVTYKDQEKQVTIEGLDKNVKVPESSQPDVTKVAIELVVETASKENRPSYVIAAENTLEKDRQELLEIFDISLMKTIYKGNDSVTKKVDNTDITGMLTVRLPLDAKYANRYGLTVVFIDDNGSITRLKTSIVTVGGKEYLEFQTNHFSAYAIVANDLPKAPYTGADESGTRWTIWTVLLIPGLAVFLYRRRTHQ